MPDPTLQNISDKIDDLAGSTQREFSAIRGEMTTGFAAVRREMATKADLEDLATRHDLKVFQHELLAAMEALLDSDIRKRLARIEEHLHLS